MPNHHDSNTELPFLTTVDHWILEFIWFLFIGDWLVAPGYASQKVLLL